MIIISCTVDLSGCKYVYGNKTMKSRKLLPKSHQPRSHYYLYSIKAKKFHKSIWRLVDVENKCTTFTCIYSTTRLNEFPDSAVIGMILRTGVAIELLGYNLNRICYKRE